MPRWRRKNGYLLEVFIGTILGTVIFSDRLQIQSLSIEARQLTKTQKENNDNQTNYNYAIPFSIKIFTFYIFKGKFHKMYLGLRKGGKVYRSHLSVIAKYHSSVSTIHNTFCWNYRLISIQYLQDFKYLHIGLEYQSFFKC